MPIDPQGKFLKDEAYNKLLPSGFHQMRIKSLLKSLMIQQLQPGKTASWISSPKEELIIKTLATNMWINNYSIFIFINFQFL